MRDRIAHQRKLSQHLPAGLGIGQHMQPSWLKSSKRVQRLSGGSRLTISFYVICPETATRVPG